jgi:hypothetical protein
MGFLAPWFVFAGVAAISLPILFHLFRRMPTGRTTFSTLMFLAPSPPRLTRRSRLENWPLLLMRAAILALLAFAFGRPFLRQWLERPLEAAGGERVLVLVDTSASMRRGDLWPRALAAVQKAIDAAGPHDDLAVMAFDSSPHSVLSFDMWRDAPVNERAGLATAALKKLSPSWSSTSLDDALIAAAEALETVGRDDSTSTAPRPQRIVLVSDLQAGAKTSGLQSFEWPKHAAVELVALSLPTSNAGLHGLETAEEQASTGDAPSRLRVLVTNAADAKRESFKLAWKADNDEKAKAVDVYAAPGQTRVVRAPTLPAGEASQLVLTGDDDPFDDSYWFVAPSREHLRVLHLAAEKKDDAASLRFFLERALGQTGVGREVTVETVDPHSPESRLLEAKDLASVPLVVVAVDRDLPHPWNELLTAWIDRGGVALAVLQRPGDAAFRALLPDNLKDPKSIVVAESDKSREYALLGELDRRHPLFAPLADPRYSDFTKIRFWRHRRLTLDDAIAKDLRVLAKFDTGEPAILESPRGKGRVIVLASGWQPKESQLGVSSKFVPLLTALVELGWQQPPLEASYATGSTVDLARLTPRSTDGESKPVGPWTARTPMNAETTVPADAPSYQFADGPGIYEFSSPAGTIRLAANLSLDESKTAPLDPETLEALGLRWHKDDQRSTAETAVQKQALQVRELESRQQGWRWCLIAALAFVLIETVYAGYVSGSWLVVGGKESQ